MNKEQRLHDIAFSTWALEFVVLAQQYCAKLNNSQTDESKNDSDTEVVFTVEQ